MTATWTDFQALRPIALDVPAAVLTDLLMSDFGMDDDWAMVARVALLKERGNDAARYVKVRFHPDSCASILAWTSGFAASSSVASERRQHRLSAKCREALTVHANHVWFKGRCLQGATGHPSLPAWLDAGVLYPTRTLGTSPVILHPAPMQAGSGVAVSRFTIEEVEEWQ